MDNIHDNPVEIIKKDIYVIKNKINDKVYIGQSINSVDRFKSHCKRNSDNSLIDKAIQKYGSDNFYCEIIESQAIDYNEKEVCWIQKLNSLTPNGYNIQSVGQDPPHLKGDEHPSTKISDEQVAQLKLDLQNGCESLTSLANKYSISKRQVLRINQGISRSKIGETYPIRKHPNSCKKLTESDIELIYELLEFSYQSSGEIAKAFNVEVHLISNINQGLVYSQIGMNYPIREWKSSGNIQFTYEQVTEIINLLSQTSLSFRAIAKEFHCGHSIISMINQGSSKKYKRKNLSYPIRSF